MTIRISQLARGQWEARVDGEKVPGTFPTPRDARSAAGEFAQDKADAKTMAEGTYR